MPLTALAPSRGERAHGDPLFTAGFRAEPEHFAVTEQLGFEPSGDGEHAFLYIEKTGANTAWVAGQLARFAGVPERDVGYAGLKDRHAVTRQWFSVRTVAATVDWQAFAAEGVEILDATRNERKLRRGAHRGNHFRIVLSGIPKRLDTGLLVARLDAIREHGVPNYFGEQRFGRRNLANALELFEGRRLKRTSQSMALSAARALLFNAIVDARVRSGSWNRLLPGELANLDGSGSVFSVDTVNPELERRLEEWDIHPSATLYGTRESYRAQGEVRALEEAAIKPFDVYANGLAAAGIDCAQRSTRVRVTDLTADLSGDLVLELALPTGAFATSVLAELGELEDLSRR